MKFFMAFPPRTGTSILLLVTLGLLAGIFVDRATSKSTNAQQVDRNQVERWEYAVITGVHWNPDKRNYWARICYFQPSGCQFSAIEGPPIPADDDGFLTTTKTFAKAAATLGQNGWEMVGEAAIGSDDKAPQRLYFKRRQK